MSNLTTEQVLELTKRVNERMAEFNVGDTPIFDAATPGIVRLVHDVFMEWQRDGVSDPEERDEWVTGFQKGLKVGFDSVRDTSPRMVQAATMARFEHECEMDGIDDAAANMRVNGHLSDAQADAINRHNKVPGWRPGEEYGEPLPSPEAIATLGPEHTIVTPLRDKLPDPEVARGKVAAALANGSNGTLATVLHRPKTLAEANGNGEDGMDEDFDLDDDDVEPKPKQTDARRAQLDRPKQERKRKTGYEQVVTGKRGNVLPTLKDVVAELQRLSLGTGVMPTIATFDAARPGNWATAWAHMQRLGVSWEQLADEAGLMLRRQRVAAG